MTTLGPDDLDEQIEFLAGRVAPFSQLGDWVGLADIPGESKALYWYLQMHVNQSRGDGVVWPVRDVLAAMGGFSRPQTIDKYIKPLAALGAIDVKKVRYANGLRARNVYTVHQTPPPGYAGFTSLQEFYKARKEAKEAAEAAEAAAKAATETAGQPDVRERAHPGASDKTAGQPRDARTRTSGKARTRTSVVRERAQELDEEKPHEGETKNKTASASPPPPPEADETLPGDGADGALFDVDQPPPPPTEETLTQRAERVTSTWWKGLLAAGATMPNQSFIAVKNVVTIQLRNNHPEDAIVGALDLLLAAEEPIASGWMTKAMARWRKQQAVGRRRAGDVNSAWEDGTAQADYDEFFNSKAASA